MKKINRDDSKLRYSHLSNKSDFLVLKPDTTK